MAPLCSNSSLLMAFTATVYFVVVLTSCNAKECELQLSEKSKDRSEILGNIARRRCHVDCVGDSFILAWCLQLRDSRQTEMPSGTSPGNHNKTLKTFCGGYVCNTTSLCQEDTELCASVCVQAPSFCDLHSASRRGNLAEVKVILSQGRADMNCEEWNSRTPVVMAAGGGHRDVVQLLVSNGADVTVVDDFGVNILHAACQGGDVALVKYILSLDKHDINGKGACGTMPVMLAAENGHRDVVELLVGQGANVSLRDSRENNALHIACRAGQMEVVKYILSLDMVDINSRGWKEMTPVMVAAEFGHKEVVDLLFRTGANVSLRGLNGNNILHYASRRGHLDVMKYVLSHAMADINSRGWKNMTSILMAAGKGLLEAVKLLGNEGANVSLLDKTGRNILHCASQVGHVEMVKYILSQAWADINSTNWKHSTPIIIAAGKGRKGVVDLLVSKGADASILDFRRRNILHRACSGGNLELVKYILSKNIADINSKTKMRLTPVLIAASSGHEEVLRFLVGKGAEVSVRDRYGSSILHHACRGGDLGVVKYVLSRNIVDINSSNKKRKTPVMMAAKKGHMDVVELLVSKGAERPL